MTALLFALLSLPAVVAGAATYYTAGTGNDANPGTLTQPFRTLKHGVSVLQPGDSLYVRAGTYAEALIGAIPGGTSWANPVTVAAYPGESVTLRPKSGPDSVLMFYGAEQYIVIAGLILDGTNVNYDAVKITVTGANSFAHHICLVSCEIKNAYEQGILVTDGANYNVFLNLLVHDNALSRGKRSLPQWYYHGIYISTDHNLIQGCRVYHNAGYGIHCYDDSGISAHDNVIYGNVSYNNGVAGNGAGIILSSGCNNIASNNVVYGNDYGISVDYSAINAGVYNNTVTANRKYGIYIGPGSVNAVVMNNIAYNNRWSPDLIDDGSQGTTYTNNLAGVDPVFLNPAANDYHLTSASTAAISQGMVLPFVPTDFDAYTRPQWPAYDLGAYMHH
jgi:parallel beta-helix repeat protein